MFVHKLAVNSFRNLTSLDLQFGSSVNLFQGQNGAGKTNLLEAIFVLLLARSWRGAVDSIMVNHDSEGYRLEGGIEIDRQQHKLAVAYQKSGKKKITIDALVAKVAELFDLSTVVSSSPDDIGILAGPPSGRRLFLNIYLGQASVRYLATLTDYHRVLAQKNSLLKSEQTKGLAAYDELLVEHGSSVTQARAGFIEKISSGMARYYREVSGGEQLTAIYRSSITRGENTGDVSQLKERFRRRLEQYSDKEKILKMALVGPHRDEVEFNIETLGARSYGSQGELRTAAIALKLAVFDYLAEVRKTTPILLLDEVFAELDNSRQTVLAGLFDRFGQVFLTTAGAVPESLSVKADKFIIKEGTIVNA